MKLRLFQLDAFASRVFAGTPAAVVPLDAWLPDVTLQAIATENNLSETAFFVGGNGDFEIRWMTPAAEVDHCGHATLASAWVVFNELDRGRTQVRFRSKSGPLEVAADGDKLALDFPARAPEPATGAAKDPQSQERARLLRLNEIAATYFQRCLWGNIGDIARRYLEERGLTRSIAEKFRLGFAPPGREGLSRFLTAQRVDLEKAAELGLVGKNQNGRYFDKFRHRLIFPITDLVGRIVGFGGRLLPMPQATDGKTYNLPKYLNSPDSVLYIKRNVAIRSLSSKRDNSATVTSNCS